MKIARLYVLLIGGFWCFSCTPKSTEKLQKTDQTEAEVEILSEESEELAEQDTTIAISKPIEEVPEPIKIDLLASIKKTACYGKCPVFEAKVYSNGRVVYQGEQFVEKRGLYEAQVSPEWIADIRTYAISLGYFKMNDYFPDENNVIADLPNTITFLQHKAVEKTITNNHNAPVQLTRFEDFFLQKLESLDWKQIIGQN